ncbi:hypothetical protein CEXT_50092 [Caerostris extrusa]|uniref:Uncharacterized protein n=1 Tax=Caerostris extrusa TaxID=172846 RepID=A0AAV4RSQ0_CAEEX|nr:hypothetical protein CEXT_50092 [Caerostris extrusa]
MWSGLAQQLLDGRLTPEVTRNSNSCFAAFSLSAGNHQGNSDSNWWNLEFSIIALTDEEFPADRVPFVCNLVNGTIKMPF